MKHECHRHYFTKALTSVRRTIAKFPFSDAQQDTYMSVVNIPQKKNRVSPVNVDPCFVKFTLILLFEGCNSVTVVTATLHTSTLTL
jgi:hypothetical protein